jgi:uncharacterized membrane protein YphA (DoxX/SURF4 family)
VQLTTSIPQSDSFRLRSQLIKATIILAIACGIFLSPKLWITGGRNFPVIPPIDGTFILPTSWNLFLVISFIGLSLGWIFYEKRWIGIAAIGSILIVIVQDQMRWQPWVYLYLIMLFACLVQSDNADGSTSTIRCLQWIISGVYVWSGIQKINPNFLDGTFAQMIKSSGIDIEFERWRNTGYVIALIEILLGVALLIPKVRKSGIFAAVVAHIIILFHLGTAGEYNNSVVFPWNIAMVIFVVLLFWNDNQSVLPKAHELRSSIWLATPVLLVWVFPILNLFGYWDHYLSFSFYSNKPSHFFIAIEESQLQKIDKRFKNYFIDIQGLQGGKLIEVNKWTFSELNVPFYPERRVFRKLSADFCKLDIDEDKLVFLELITVDRKPFYSKFTCEDSKQQ